MSAWGRERAPLLHASGTVLDGDREGRGNRRERSCAMAMGRVEFRNGRAIAYDELGRKRTEKQCDKLVGYGPKGFVIKVLSPASSPSASDCFLI